MTNLPDPPAPPPTQPRVPPTPAGVAQPVAGQQTQSAAPHERHSYPCQRAYRDVVRNRILEFLTKPRRNRLLNSIQRTARAGFVILDMPVRWLMDLFDAVAGNRGDLAVGSLLAAYLAAFGLIDTKSTQEETRAALERSLFITLVSANAASFVAAMKDFGPTQTMSVTEHPSLLRFWEWGRRYPPNREPMLRWAKWRLGLCSKERKDCSVVGGTRLELNGADLSGADLGGADLHGADLGDANLSGANLTGVDVTGAPLTDLRWADMFGVDLRDANLRGAYLEGTDLGHARYSANTIFPPDFDPKAPKAPTIVPLVLTANQPAKGGWFAWLSGRLHGPL